MTSRQLEATFVIGVSIAAGAIRLHNLGARSLWYDEAVLYWISQGSIAEVISQNAQINSAPPLYAIAINILSHLGQSEIALRSLSWLAGTLGVAAFYALSRQYVSVAAAMGATLVALVSPAHIEYSQTLREYSLTFLLASLILYFHAKIIKHHSRWRILGGSLVLVLSIFVQYGLAILILALTVALPLFGNGREHRRRVFRDWGISLAPAVLSVVGVFGLSLRSQLKSGGFVYLDYGYWDSASRSIVRFLAEQSYDVIFFAFPATTLFALMLIAGSLGRLSDPSTRWPTIGLLVPFAFAAALGVAGLYPYLGHRQIMYLLPLLYLFIAFGFSYLVQLDSRRILISALLILMLGLGARKALDHLTYTGYQDMRSITEYLDSHVEGGDAIFVSGGAIPAFRYYYSPRVGMIEEAGRGEEWQDQILRLINAQVPIWVVIAQDGSPQTYTEFVGRQRPIEEVISGDQAWLYLAAYPSK
ncbi:MAG: glycosyltransferase family 39 protein [Anaerolineales bacterium]